MSLNPVVELRNSFEGLPAAVRRPIEMVVFGGELPRADISGMRRMAAEFRAKAGELGDHSEDAKDLLAQEDSAGMLGDRLRETLRLHRDGAARLGDDALALADQAQAAAGDAEKTLCVMFVFGIELAWRIFGVLSGAAAAGPAGEMAAVPVVESMLVEGRGSVAVMRAGLEQAFRAGATRTAARLSALGSLRLPVTLGKAAALPVGVDAGVQALQVVSGDRTLGVIGPDGENPTGIDLTSIKVAALSGAGGALGGMVAGRVAPKVFTRIEGSRLALGLVHGTAGAVAGLGAATLVTGWPEHFDQVLAPLLNGGFAGVVHAHAPAHSGSGAVIDGGGAFTRPDLPAATRSEETASPTPALPPVEVSAESKQAWEAAKRAWAAAPDTAAAGNERGEAPAAGAHGNTAPVKSGEPRSPAVSGSMPHNEATGRAAVGLDAAAASAGRSQTDAPVERPQRGESVARTNATAPRPVDAGGETSAPPKVSTSTPARQVGTGPETPAAGEHRSPGNHEHGNTGNRSAAADELPHESPVDTRPATGTGDGPETPAAGEHRLPGNEEHAPAAEGRVPAGETSDEVAADPATGSVDSAGSPAPNARDQAVELLADFHAGSGDQVPKQLRLCNLSDEVLKAGLFDTDSRTSMIATTEIIRRGTISDAMPGGMVLRVEQAEGMYALDKRPVEMKPGEGKSLMFMAAAMQRAVRHGECLLVTTTDGLAHREFTRYRQLLTDFGIDVIRADQQKGFGPVTAGRPAVVVATGETVGHLCNAGHRPPRHALIDEMDGIIDRGDRQFLRSEGVEQTAPEATAREVFAAHDFLADALKKGALSHEDFGLTRIIEEVDLYPDGTPEVEFWYDGQAYLTPTGREKIEALPGGERWLEGMGLSRLEMAAAAEFSCRDRTHYVMDAGKIVIVDQSEHGLQRNPKTSSESRWSAETGKASLAQAVEAKEIRAAEAIGMSAERHQIVVRADAEDTRSITAVEIYRQGGRFFDEVTGASGTLADLNPVLEKIYGLEEAHQVNRSREQRLMEGAPDVVENTRAKLSTIAEEAHRRWQGGRGRFQEILCHRNDLVDRQVQALVRQGVPREAIEAVDADRMAGWGAHWEAELQKVFDAAGDKGKILVINRQGQRGVDISVSEAVLAQGGMFVWMTEVPEQSYIYEQAKNRTARNGAPGAAQALMSPQDALIRNAMHLHGVREAAVRYDRAAAAQRTDPTPENHDNLVQAGHNLGSLVPELQQRALRHATADFIRHHAYITDNPAAVLAAAETGRYQGLDDVGQPDQSPDQAARLAGLLGIPAAAVAGTAAALEQDGADDPLGSLLEQTGLPPTAVEALRQQVEATAPATVAQYARLTDEQALDQLVPQRDQLAGELGWDTEDIDGAEGMRKVDPALTEARNNLAQALGYPVSSITPAIARDILGEVVDHHLPAEGAHQPAARDDAFGDKAAPNSVNPVSVSRVAESPVAEDVIAAASCYLATAALLDLVVAIHRRSPNSCVNNAVTGMRVLTGRRLEMPSTSVAGHGRAVVEDVFGAPLENAGSLDDVAESLKTRPGGIAVLVYKWKDAGKPRGTSAEAKGSIDANNHMVLLVNDSEPGEQPKLVVVDLAAARDGRTDIDYGPKDLQNRRTLLDKAVPFETWRQEQQKFLDKLPTGKHLFETIDFDRDGNLIARFHRDVLAAETLPRSQDVEVDAETVQEINSIQLGWPVDGDGTPDLPSRTDADVPDKVDIYRSAEPAVTGSRPHETPDPAERAPAETLSDAPVILQSALAVVAGIQCSPDIARDAQRFAMRCYEEYRQQQMAALQKRRRTALVDKHGMSPEEAEQAAKEYVGSAEARLTIDAAAARGVGELIVDLHRTADRAQISLPDSLADLYRAEANTANARTLAKSMKADTGDTRAPGDQVGTRPHEAAQAREIADRLAIDPRYSPLDAYRDARLHAAEMREEHSGFRWQLVVGPGADVSDPGTLADTVAARLPESCPAREREDIIDSVARLAALALPRAGRDAVVVVTSSQDADGRRRLLAQLDYTRPDPTDPAPGVTAEELRRELSDVDGRIDVDTADPLPDGQVWHRVRLDLTRQRILVCCTYWGRGGSGMSTLNLALCQGLAEAGHEVIVWAGGIAQGSRISGVKMYGGRESVSAPGGRKLYDGDVNDLPQSVDLVIVHAEDGGIRAALAAEARYPAAKLVSIHHLTPMLWETLGHSPERGRAKVAARIYLARRAHLVTGLGPILATDALSAAVMAGHGSVHELQPGLEIAEQPPEPAPGDPAWILLFGRVDDQLKGAAEAAEVVKRLRAQGRDVRLAVRGYPKRGIESAHAALAELVGDPAAVEVRPYTSSGVEVRDDIRAATVVVMPSRAEGFGVVATEAIEQGVPVAVPSSSGVGRFLAELADYRDLAQQFNLVEQPLAAQVPIDNWVAGLGSVLDDLPGAWAAARGLQGLMRSFTRENSARMLVHAARNTDPHPRPAIPPSRTRVSLEAGHVVARGEEEDYLRILAVADAMESDPAVREAVIGGTRLEFAPSRDSLTTGTASADDGGAGARSRAGGTAEVLADTVARLREIFDQSRSAEVIAGEEESTLPTPWARSKTEPDQPSTRSNDAEPGGNSNQRETGERAGPGGLIGSRPREQADSQLDAARNVFDERRTSGVTTSKQGPAPLTPWTTTRAEPDQPPARSSDSKPGEGSPKPGGLIGNRPAAGEGGPRGLIGSRPFEDSPGERAFAGPGFEELVLAGLDSGIAERFVAEDAPGVKVEEVTFDNGLRVFRETYTDPIDALVQVLQTEVAAIMGAPVAHAILNLEDDRIYRELTPGRPGDSVEVVDPEVLGSSSATMLGLFDAVTGTHRTAREWSVADNEVMGGRSRSDVDATPAGVFASSFVRRVDGREVWLDHAMPTWDVAAIREPVSYLEAWISNFPMPEEHREVLLDVHSRYVAALAQVERHAVHTSGEMVHRAGLDVQARAKARLVEAFNLKYPHVAMVGFDHPDVPAHVVEEILGGLDEMFTRFPGRTNIRELRIDYTASAATSARTHYYADPEASGRTLSMQFSLRDAARPAQAVERGIRLLELGLNPVGDRPFHHDAVHEFVHAIDAVEGLSKNLRQVLSQTYSQLSGLGLIDEHWWTWFARLPEYAFGNEAKTVLNDVEALAVGFAEADIHGVAVGSPQWAVHEYVTTGRPPRVTSDLEVDLPAHVDPDSDGSGGLIGSRPCGDEHGETPWRPTPGQATPWSRKVIDEPNPDHQLREHPSHTIPEGPADNTPGQVPLTPRETEVLARVRQGMTHNDIAAALDLPVRDVRANLTSVRRKLRNERARLVAASRPADPPSTTSEFDRFRAAMYAALMSADQPDPRQLLAEASPEQMESAVQGLSSAHRGALHRLRAGAGTPVIRSMALIAARRWVTTLAAEHNRSMALLATALAEASPADLQTALDQLTAAELQLLVDRFGPATSPATFEPDDSVRRLRAVDIVRHVAARFATHAGMSTVSESGFDKSGFQRGQHLVDSERPAAAQHTNYAAAQTYSANECLDAVLDWIDRQAPPEPGKRSRGGRRGSSSAAAQRWDGRSQQDGPPGGGGPIAGAHPATAGPDEPERPGDNNDTASTQAAVSPAYRWHSLPVDHGFDDEQRRLADEALRAGGFDDADMLQLSGDRLFADSAQRRATENGEWWNSLSDPAEPGELSTSQKALIQVYPHQIGNADGLPATIRDHANRLSISRDLGEFIARKPADQRLLNWLRTDLTDAERKQLGNLIRTRNHLQELDRQAAEIPGSPPVHLLSYDSTAFGGKGKAVVSLGNVDTAHTVNWHVPGTNTTSSSLAYQFKPLRNLYEETLRVDPSLELASIIWIGYDAPAGPVNTGYAKAAFRRRARVGGRRLLCDIAAFHATRSLAGTAAPDQLVIRIYAHSYGSVTMFYAGRYGGFAGLVRSATASGSPGAATVRHAADLGIGADNVYVAASWRDLVTMFGADQPGAWSRFNPRLGLGIDPATEAFGAKRIGAEFPDSPDFAGVEAVHQGYLHRDPATGLPTEALANVAQITAGRGDTLGSVDRRQSRRGLVTRHIDSERGRYADANRTVRR